MTDKEEIKEIQSIVDFLNDVPALNIKDKNNFNFNVLDKESKTTIDDYASLVNINLLKQDPKYYYTKWSIIIKHLIDLDDYFLYFAKNEVIPESEMTISEITQSEDTKDEKSGAKKKKKKKKKKDDSSSSTSNFNNMSVENIKPSTMINKDNQTKEINEFKLHYIRKKIQDLNFDIMDGISYEHYVKRTIFVMLFVLKIDDYQFLHPTGVPYKKLMEKSHVIEPDKIKGDVFEIDLLINGFRIKDLILLINQYPKYFFFSEKLQLNDIKNNNKVNIVSEISKDLINSAPKKYKLEEKYINVLKAFTKIRTNEILAVTNEEYKKIIDSFLIEPDNENIFIFITNGSYFLLKFAVEKIEEIFNNTKLSQKSSQDIRNFIDKEINGEKKKGESSIYYNCINNINNLTDKLFTFYQIFYDLRKNNIKHCLFYIGEESGTEYEDGILKICKEKKSEIIKNDISATFKIKKLISDLSKINLNFENIIKDFEKKVKEIIIMNEKKINDLFQPYNLQENDLIKIKIYITENEKSYLNGIEKFEKFRYEINVLNNEEMIEAFQKIIEDKINIIWFPSDNAKLLMMVKNNISKDEQIYGMKPETSVELLELIPKVLPDEFILRKCYTVENINPNIFKSDEIFDITKLLNKIKDDLKIEIRRQEIDELLKISLDKNILEHFYNDIKENINSVNKVIEIQNCENKLKIFKEIYEKRIILLTENIKAIIFYDYVYYSILPGIKYKKCLELYKNKI